MRGHMEEGHGLCFLRPKPPAYTYKTKAREDEKRPCWNLEERGKNDYFKAAELGMTVAKQDSPSLLAIPPFHPYVPLVAPSAPKLHMKGFSSESCGKLSTSLNTKMEYVVLGEGGRWSRTLSVGHSLTQKMAPVSWKGLW